MGIQIHNFYIEIEIRANHVSRSRLQNVERSEIRVGIDNPDGHHSCLQTKFFNEAAAIFRHELKGELCCGFIYGYVCICVLNVT